MSSCSSLANSKVLAGNSVIFMPQRRKRWLWSVSSIDILDTKWSCLRFVAASKTSGRLSYRYITLPLLPESWKTNRKDGGNHLMKPFLSPPSDRKRSAVKCRALFFCVQKYYIFLDWAKYLLHFIMNIEIFSTILDINQSTNRSLCAVWGDWILGFLLDWNYWQEPNC